MKVLITGGCGFIGTNLALRCIEEEWDTIVIDNSPQNYNRAIQDLIPKYYGHKNNSDFEFQMISEDFASDRVLSDIRKNKYDIIFHEAAVPRVPYSVENPIETTKENLMKTIDLLEAASGNCRRFVFASSSSIYGNTQKLPIEEKDAHGSCPQSPYAQQKKCAEEFVQLFCSPLYGLDAISLRYFNVIGPHQYGDSPYATALSSWCYRIKNNMPLRKDGTGEQSRDLCYVDNVVEANIKAAKSPNRFSGEAINIACGEKISNNEILGELSKRFEFDIQEAPFRPGDIMHTLADISFANQMIGYEPVVKFWEGFEKILKWWKLT